MSIFDTNVLLPTFRITNHAGGSQGWFGALPLPATGGVSSLSILLVFTLICIRRNKYRFSLLTA
jgi:hypothetical protein